jgi:hypothetical protein
MGKQSPNGVTWAGKARLGVNMWDRRILVGALAAIALGAPFAAWLGAVVAAPDRAQVSPPGPPPAAEQVVPAEVGATPSATAFGGSGGTLPLPAGSGSPKPSGSATAPTRTPTAPARTTTPPEPAKTSEPPAGTTEPEPTIALPTGFPG